MSKANATTAATTAAKKAKQSKVAKPAAAETNAAAAQVAILAAIKRRIENADNANQRETLSAEYRFFDDANAAVILTKCEALKIDVQSLAKQIAVLKSESKNDFLAVYALQKVRKALYALANNARSGFDGYTNSILFNLVKLQTINNKESRMSICNSIEYSETEQVQTLKRLHNCSESTASTQASSTRMMLKALNLANVIKQKNNDSITLHENDAARAVVAFYA
jgi:hypothetical protein